MVTVISVVTHPPNAWANQREMRYKSCTEEMSLDMEVVRVSVAAVDNRCEVQSVLLQRPQALEH